MKSLDLMLKEEKKRIKEEANSIIINANKEVEQVIRKIKEINASKETTKILHQELTDKKHVFFEKGAKKIMQFAVGDVVKIVGQDSIGTIKKVKGKQVEVFFGILKFIVSTEKIEKTTEKRVLANQRKIKKKGIDLNIKVINFKHKISIRGMRFDEAMKKVETFLDDAIIVGADEVKIIHGKGYGILKEMVRNITKEHPGIANMKDEHPDRGGAGISIIKLK